MYALFRGNSKKNRIQKGKNGKRFKRNIVRADYSFLVE
jgi:hypothetical protein